MPDGFHPPLRHSSPPTMTSQRKGILVTGTHRSGTTWMGKILSLPEEVVYVQEPFNLETSTNSIDYRFRHWFPHVEDLPDRERLFEAMERTLRFAYVPRPPAHLSRYRAARRVVRMHLENAVHRMRGRTPLVKDPLALFSAEELASRFSFDVVCMIRHPLAFCSSLKRWDWKFPFAHFVEQPRLMDTFFTDDADVIRDYAGDEKPIVQQAVLLWNLFHKVIRRYESDHPEWHFRRHVDMVLDPVDRFRALYDDLELPFGQEIEEHLRESVSGGKGETNTDVYGARDAAAVTQTWKKRLTPEEADYILAETRELRAHFYPDEAKVFPTN